VLVPQAIAYALLAGMPPVYGLYTSCIPLVIYAATTSSKHTCVGPFALMSIVTGVLARDVLGPGASLEQHIETVLAITVVAGMVQLAMGLLRLGLGASLLADTSVAGFTTASALIIAGSQLHHVLGVPIPRGGFVPTLVSAARIALAGEANGAAVAISLSALVYILGVKRLGQRCCRRVPLFEQLQALLIFTLIARLAGLDVPRVGDSGPVPSGLPRFRVPALPGTLEQNLQLLEAGATAGVTSFLLTVSISRTFALKHGYTVCAQTELVSLGLVNLVGGFFGAYTSSGSLSRSALCSSVGGRTPLHGLFQAAVVAAVLLGATPLFAPLPYAVLAAIIAAALVNLVDLELPARLWRSARADFWLWAIAFVGTVLFGVQPGLALAIGSSLALLVVRASRPQSEVLGRLPGTELWRDASRWPCAQQVPAVLVFRFGSPLHFANSEFFCDKIRRAQRRRAARGQPLSTVVLDCSSLCAVDYSANTCLCGLLAELREARVCVLLACTRSELRESLAALGTLGTRIPAEQVFVTVTDAVSFAS
ncbi:sulfate transporter family-domain-containing protein, partial [Pavlovales sp. CCMP2436]